MLSPSQYESLLEAMEDLEDISAFDAAVARNESANVYQSQLIYFQRIQSRQNQKSWWDARVTAFEWAISESSTLLEITY